MMIALLLAATALGAPPPETPAPTPGQVAVHRVLSARHAPGCAAADAVTDDPVVDLVAIAEGASMPPWAGLRAAGCLVERHAVEARPHLERWVGSAELRGLGRVVLTELDHAPLEVALPVARRALADGPDPADVRRRLLRSDVPELRALVEGVAP